MTPIGRGSEDFNGIEEWLTDGADKGGEDSEGWNASPFASGGYEEEKREMSVVEREGGGSTRGVADAGDGQSTLIVQTYRYLFVLDINGKQMPPDESQGNPVLLKKIDLLKGGFPLGMGVLKLEKDRIYMFGGYIECSRKKSRVALKRSCEPFFYELNSKTRFLNVTSEVDNTKATKIYPWVTNIDDKIIVVDMEYGCKGSSGDILEFYDLTSKTWKEFPRIPTQESWSKDKEAIITSRQDSAFVLVGYKLYIKVGPPIRKLFFCLNTRTQEWDLKSASNLCESIQLSPLHFPHRGTYISRIDGLDPDQNIILTHIGRKIYAYLIDDSGYLLCYQDLTDKLCRDIINPCFSNGILFIDQKRGGRVCMVLIDHPSSAKYGFYVEQSIFIQHFELKLKKGLKLPFKKMDVPGGRVRNKFVNVEIFKNQRCTLSLKDWELILCDAVLL